MQQVFGQALLLLGILSAATIGAQDATLGKDVQPEKGKPAKSDLSKDDLHIVLIAGNDPGNYSRFSGLSTHLRSQGFKYIYTFPHESYRAAQQKLRDIRDTNPDARIVLLGYSMGAIRARQVMNDLQPYGIHVDLLVYLGGNTIRNVPFSRPANAERILNLIGDNVYFRGADPILGGGAITGAQNYRLSVGHYDMPNHPDVHRYLAEELAGLMGTAAASAAVPVVSAPAAPAPADSAPRTITPPAAVPPMPVPLMIP